MKATFSLDSCRAAELAVHHKESTKMTVVQRQPTNTLGMVADWSAPPMAGRNIHVSKDDLNVCAALCCGISYIDQNHGCLPLCHGHQQVLCFAQDGMCLGGPLLAGDNHDKSLEVFCTFFGATLYPCGHGVVGCCKKVKDYYPDVPEMAPKGEYLSCIGMCGFCCTANCTIYLKEPTTCCSKQCYCFSCIYDECAMPCDKAVLVACNCPWLPGLMLCQSGKFQCSCCPKAGTYFEVANLTEALEPATFAGGVVDGEPKSTGCLDSTRRA